MRQNNEDKIQYQPGDWIVHAIHGPGRVTAIEEKNISSKDVKYYRTHMENSWIWIPVSDDSLIRPISPAEKFAEALEILNRQPRKMSSTFKKRSKRIEDSRAEATPLSWSRTIRDLWARKRNKGHLSQQEDRAMKRMINHLVSEWAASMDLEKGKVERRLFRLLNRDRPAKSLG